MLFCLRGRIYLTCIEEYVPSVPFVTHQGPYSNFRSLLTEESHDEQGFAGRQPLRAEGGRLGEQRGLAAAALAVQHQRLAGGSRDVGLHLLQVLLPAVEHLTGTGQHDRSENRSR